MTGFKKLTDNYTVIPNQIFKLEAISIEAKYVYIYLRSKPETWKPHMVEIQKSTGMGRARVMRCRKELMDAGLLSYKAKKEGGGVYTLHEITGVQKPDSGKPVNGFSNPLVSTDLLVSTDSNKSTSDSNESDPFEELWKEKPQRPNQSKQKARSAYNARIKEGINHADLLAGLRRYNAMTVSENTQPKFTKHLATFLGKGEFWNLPYEVAQKVPDNIKDIRRLIREKNLDIPNSTDMYVTRKHIAAATGMQL